MLDVFHFIFGRRNFFLLQRCIEGNDVAQEIIIKCGFKKKTLHGLSRI